MLWPEFSVYERFGQAALAGFRCVEYLFPHLLDIDALDAAIRRSSTRLVLFDVEPGNLDRGELGMLCHPGRESEFERSVDSALALAQRLSVRRLNCLTGLRPIGVSREHAEVALRNLGAVKSAVESSGVILLIEAINDRDRPGYLAHTVDIAAQLVEAADSPSIRLLFDLYHVTVSGDPLADFERHAHLVSHVQLADAPGRHQPGTGVAPVHQLLARLRRMKYDGYVGLEYVPLGPTNASLEWLPRSERGETSIP